MPDNPIPSGRATPGDDTGTGAALNAVPVSSVGGGWVSIQIVGTFVATVSFEQSNDGVTWYALPMSAANGVLPVAPVISTAAVGLWAGPVSAEFWRARISAYTSGTVSAFYAVGEAGSSLIVDTELPAAAALADAAANPTTPTTGGALMVFNGTTWDRARSASTGPTVGTGVQAVSNGTGAVTSFAAGSSAIANGTALSMGSAKTKHTMVIATTGTPAAGTVQLQGSLDGTSWFSMGAAQSPVAAGVTVLHATDQNAIQIRAAITVAFVGGTVEVKLASSG